MNLKEFVARQLNDHDDSPSGVKQATYTEWKEQHICDALQMGMCYLYSLIPQEFSELKTHTVTEESCLVDLSDICHKFISLSNLSIGDNQCVDLEQEDESEDESIDLLGVLGDLCVPEGDGTDDDQDDDVRYNWTVADGSTSVLKFKPAVPAGAVLTYLCAPAPAEKDLDNANLCQYHSLITSFALWWLLLTDTESRSNLDRADRYFAQIQFFVETKLQLEFSLREDDYNYGRRKVSD